MASFKVLIIGGGVTGPALAYWLSRVGASITLIERSPDMRATGQQVDIRAQGVPMMKKMGIEAAVRAVSVQETGMQLIDAQGRTKAFFPASEQGAERQSFTSDYEIMRGDLVQILYKLTENKPNVQHLFNSSVESLTQDAESDENGKVHVVFKDGRKDDFDLVVGADGSGSRTRKMMLGPDAPDPRHPSGGFIGYFSIPSKTGDSDRGTFCHLPGGRIIGTRKDRPDLTRVYMLTRHRDPAMYAAYQAGNVSDMKDAIATLYRDGAWESKRFMEALQTAPEANDLYCTPFEEVRLPSGSWSKGRIVLVGDAAHGQTANGFGCSWGLVGSYILAGEITALSRKNGSTMAAAVAEAAKKYEEKFRPIATATHGGSERLGSLLFPSSNIGIWVLHTIARAAAYFRFGMASSLDDSSRAKWRLPEYPELEVE